MRSLRFLGEDYGRDGMRYSPKAENRLARALMLLLFALVLCLLPLASCKKDDTPTIRYLNFKPEIAEKYKELAEIKQENKAFPVGCQFCSEVYEFTPEDIRELIKNS